MSRIMARGGVGATAVLRIVLAALVLAMPGQAAGGATAGPPSAGATTLRIETGGHGAPIRGMAADRAGRFVVTASEDKTARVWDAVTGSLLQVFRPPSSPGNEGKLFAAAMLPDGALFAAAGWSAANDIYLVRRSSGELAHRITGLPNVITALAFSPDGRLLAVGLWGGHGVRLFTSGDGWQSTRESAGDGEVGGEIHGLAWSHDGSRLAASAADGVIRLYEPTATGLRLLRRKPSQGRELPYGLAFSPDGRHLAVGAANVPSFAILNASSLERLGQVGAAGGVPGGLSSVAWSPDGSRVYAAGAQRNGQGRFTLCIGGLGMSTCTTEQDLAGNTVTGLITLGNGSILYSAADPVWGSVDGNGRLSFARGAELRDFRDFRREFVLAKDGAGVAIRPRLAPTDENAFDLRGLAWRRAPSGWTAPAATAARTSVESWFETPHPAINGQRLRLDDNEVSLTAAVSAKGDRVAIGTNFLVRCYGASGRELWRTAVPGTTWQVNFSADGRWLVAAFSDGTLRWLRAQDGREQIALLPHPDGRRWVAWTPRGYFAVSAGGEDLLGWQVERGQDHGGDFFPASRFREAYHRPEIIAAVLALGDEEAAVRAQATPAGRPPVAEQSVLRQLPPVVRILSPEDGQPSGSAQARLVVAVEAAADAPLARLRVRVNGAVVPVPEIAALRAPPGARNAGADTFELPVPLPEADADVMVFAENRHGFSPPAVVRIPRAPAGPARVAQPASEADNRSAAPIARPPAALGPGDLRPALYVLAIGVSQYADKSIQLEFSAKDATDLVNLLKTQEGPLYRKVAVKLLTDANARRDDVLDGLEWIRREITARDVGVVFLAGHGVNDSDGVYYFLPHDTEVKRLKRTGVIFTEIRNTLVSLPGKALFFVDTCHSGNVLGTGLRALPNDTTAIVNELSSAENGVIVFTATTGRQYAQESDSWGNGAFTKALLEGLGGKADMAQSGRITHKMLDLYVSERVKALTEGSQSPVTIVPRGIPDFPLAVNLSPAPTRR